MLAGDADLAIADLPAQQGAGGFGLAMGLARRGMARTTGRRMAEPLSGQRAIRWEALPALLPFAPGFGIEVAMTIDALHAGLRVVEVEVDLHHNPTGKDLSGLLHRARQARAIARELTRRKAWRPTQTPADGGSPDWEGSPGGQGGGGAFHSPPANRGPRGQGEVMRALPVALCGVLVGWGIGFWAAPQVLAGLARSSLARVNYRKREVVAGLGLLLPIGLLVWAAPLGVAARVDPLRAVRAGLLAPSGLAVVVAGLSFVVLGLVDDLVEDPGGSRGFRGHLRALAAGRLTGGGIKLLGGGLAGLLVASLATPGDRPAWAVLLGGLVVASAANTANLLDLRPGRCAKVFLPLWVVGCLLDPGGGAWSAGLAGAALAALPFDLREEGMLGDAGANALGAVVGTLFLAGPIWLLWAAAAVLLALQLASERVSFSRVIEANRVLRAADRLGRRGT